jgi:Thioredoxin like C-terminal domain
MVVQRHHELCFANASADASMPSYFVPPPPMTGLPGHQAAGQDPSRGFGSGSRASARLGSPLEHLRLNQWGLAGEWTSGAEKVTLEGANGGIAFRFHARDAHLVLSRAMSEPIPFRLLLDGNAPGHAHGIDVDEDGGGVLDEGRLYQLVRQREPVRDRTLEITFAERGAEAYVFTFG